jgi:integrase
VDRSGQIRVRRRALSCPRTGSSYWPSVGTFVATYGQFFMAADTHHFRHSYATDLLRRGVAAEVVQKLLGHASISTTIDTYSHLDIEDTRRALVTAGVLTDASPEWFP